MNLEGGSLPVAVDTFPIITTTNNNTNNNKSNKPLSVSASSRLPHHPSQHQRASRSRQSPEGKEREFPATRVGQQQQQAQAGYLQFGEGNPDHNNDENEEEEGVAGGGKMGSGDDRYYSPSSSAASNLRCAGQLGQSRDFHYTVKDHPHHYSGGGGGLSRSSRASRDGTLSNSSGSYHGQQPQHASLGSSGTGGGSRSRGSSQRDATFYLGENKSGSPYHHRSSNVRSAGIRSSRDQHENYLLLRQQQVQAAAAAAAQAEYLQHHSGSRQDLLEHDHNAIYEMATAYNGVPPPPPQQYSFVRTCDGKFVRTNIPIQDFESLVESRNYYHTLRRPSKRQSAGANVSTSGANDPYGCCPSRDEMALSAGSRALASGTQSYATLRGRKQRNACAAQGVGDNYGRNQFSPFPMDDSRSLASFTDDFLSIPPNDAVVALGGPTIGNLNNTAINSTPHSRSSRMSRSTDRNLENVGLSDEELLMSGGLPMRTSDEILALLPREPPDGKEKPEPSKTSSKMETLSRKNSKYDLIENSKQQHSNNSSSSTSDADAASIISNNLNNISTSKNNNNNNSGDSGSNKRDSLTGTVIKDSSTTSAMFLENNNSSNLEMQQQQQQMSINMSDNEMDSGMGSSIPSSSNNKEWKSMIPGSPRPMGSSSSSLLVPPSSSTSASTSTGGSTSFAQQQQQQNIISSSSSAPKATRTTLSTGSLRHNNSSPASVGVAVNSSRSVVTYGTTPPAASSITTTATSVASNTSSLFGQSQHHHQQQQQHQQQQTIAAQPAKLVWHEKLKKLVIGGTAKWFGVDNESEEINKLIWLDRRKRLAIKRFGGIKDSEFPIDGSATNSQYAEGCFRMRYNDHHLTSELEGDRMVLKITKPPRNKESLSGLTAQGISWMINSLTTRKLPVHQIVSDHEISRSYQPSVTGIAAYYQAEQTGGLAVCPPRLPRVPSNHLLHGDSPVEEVFFTKPNCDDEEDRLVGGAVGGPGIAPMTAAGKRVSYSSDPYRPYNWRRPLPDSDHLPRMSSDVGASRIWNRLLDAAFDNSDRRKHGMGAVGRVLSRRRNYSGRARHHAPETNRKRKLGGNASDHRPYFTYWITIVQILVLFISMASYGVGPVGIDLYKKAGMVLVTNLELEPVGHLEPANFWIGPSATALIHLGAKYAPCMRWDSALDRDIKEERLKERDTACCIRKDRAGCVQSPKTECSKVGEAEGEAGTPRSNWWRQSEWYSKYPNENRRSSGPVCGLDPAYCEAPASVAPYIWPDDITKWPICRRKTDVDNLDTTSGHAAEHMVCEIIGHPCCIGIRGQCKIATKEYCLFVGGTFHEEAALCSQVSCLDDVCGLLPFRDRDVPDQFYRTWTPLFIHAGVIHLVITVCLQFWIMRDLEKLAGAGRIAIIYVGAGMIGNLASAIFVPYRAEVGPSGAHFGLLAACMVEIIHQWPILRYPEMALLKLVGVTAVLFLTGLLPWIDNYAHLFGFISGFLLSYAILPYVTLGNADYDRRRKCILIWICVVAVLFMFVGLLLLFYITPIHDCEICKYFNCIPITKDFCADQNIDLTIEI